MILHNGSWSIEKPGVETPSMPHVANAMLVKIQYNIPTKMLQVAASSITPLIYYK
jgi:hypothetical protein